MGWSSIFSSPVTIRMNQYRSDFWRSWNGPSHHLDILAVKSDAAVPGITHSLDQRLILVPGYVSNDDPVIKRNTIEQMRRRWLEDLGNGHD